MRLGAKKYPVVLRDDAAEGKSMWKLVASGKGDNYYYIQSYKPYEG